MLTRVHVDNNCDVWSRAVVWAEDLRNFATYYEGCFEDLEGTLEPQHWKDTTCTCRDLQITAQPLRNREQIQKVPAIIL